MNDYAPGWSPDMLAMLTGRTAAERAAFVLPLLTGRQRVLDLGCGPGTITEGLSGFVLGIDGEPSQLTLAQAAAPTARFAAARADALPIATHAVDVAFAHALFEHLPDPAAALTELRRVLRPEGILALSSSDWSGADITPRTPDVEQALEGHYRLRRAAGGDPFLGGRLPDLVRANGFVDVQSSIQERVDMTYRDLADYIRTRLLAAGDHEAAEAAARWADHPAGHFIQRWVEVTARTP
ncbi:MAG TPA: methyltransferase domain-containing protein [Pseudonocardiaceae bacterium]|jgi:SAM-dependent methyltransferase